VTYAFIFASVVAAAIITVAAVGSRPSKDADGSGIWLQAHIEKSDRIVTGSIPKK
jgi:hypothetical protein